MYLFLSFCQRMFYLISFLTASRYRLWPDSTVQTQGEIISKELATVFFSFVICYSVLILGVDIMESIRELQPRFQWHHKLPNGQKKKPFMSFLEYRVFDVMMSCCCIAYGICFLVLVYTNINVDCTLVHLLYASSAMCIIWSLLYFLQVSHQIYICGL